MFQKILTKTQDNRNRSEEHTSELQSQSNLVCRLLLEKKKFVNKTCIPRMLYTIKKMNLFTNSGRPLHLPRRAHTEMVKNKAARQILLSGHLVSYFNLP